MSTSQRTVKCEPIPGRGTVEAEVVEEIETHAPGLGLLRVEIDGATYRVDAADVREHR